MRLGLFLLFVLFAVYYYSLTYYFDGEERNAEGITYGETWTEVMSRLTEYYGEEE